MKVSSIEISRALQDLWPHLTVGFDNPHHIWIPRHRYWAPSRKNFEEMIGMEWNVIAKHIEYTNDIWMCSNMAAAVAVVADLYVLHLQSIQAFKPEAKLEWAVGEVWGTKFRGQPMAHSVSLTMLENKELWFFEPQPHRDSDGNVITPIKFDAWKADPEKDKIHFYKL